MNCRQIIAGMEELYPTSMAESWDNPGLLVGTDDREVRRVYLALDVTRENLREAVEWKADMIISHHPMIFSPMKQINNHHFTGEKVLEILKNDITYYAMHTNFDVCRMAEINATLLDLREQEVLMVTKEGEQPEGIGRVGSLPRAMTLEACAVYVKKAFTLPQVKVFGNLKMQVTRAAVSGGSGKSMVGDALAKKAQVLITGDIDHHTGLDAWDQGLAIIDAGHYGTEYFFMEQVRRDLEELDRSLKVMCAPVKLPYTYI